MPTLQLASDLHFECHGSLDPAVKIARIQRTDAYVLVLAGDIINLCDPFQLACLILLCEWYPHVIYVPGNHEFWGQSTGESETVLRALDEVPNLHVLSHATSYTTTIRGQRFIGDTMWVPDTSEAWLTRTNDPAHIPGFRDWAFALNRRFKGFLYENLEPTDVVITHYLPSWKSVSPRFAGDPSNAWFVSDMARVIAHKQPKLWMHGHTHDRVDYQLGETRVVCNPGGYPKEKMQSSYDPARLITY